MRARISPIVTIDGDPDCGTGECNFGGQPPEGASLLGIGDVQIFVAGHEMQDGAEESSRVGPFLPEWL